MHGAQAPQPHTLGGMRWAWPMGLGTTCKLYCVYQEQDYFYLCLYLFCFIYAVVLLTASTAYRYMYRFSYRLQYSLYTE